MLLNVTFMFNNIQHCHPLRYREMNDAGQNGMKPFYACL
jgi:hypothetical protein